jgi:quinol monooxygenase YgiN
LTVLQFERYPVDANRTDGFEALVQTLLTQVRAAPGVLWADASKAFDDEPSYLVLSEWRTEADLEAWEAGTEALAFLEQVDVHLRGEPTRRRFTGA